MSLWWLQPGWKQTKCCSCGATIWPEGDPDWGACFACFSASLNRRAAEEAYYREQEEAYMHLSDEPIYKLMVRVPESLRRDINRWRHANEIASMNEAIRQLLRERLDAEPKTHKAKS
jgi:recombinational DNA repair protein (RecF pathway)